ncbi:hypothetical protein MOX02_50680 [Methylobacterium oxalidis]|uniref:Uncharacterized protein n=1 Tax=Methylobacterium oxalidis TaxID=944322 RepID=A0A512JAN9_9HYPH|nr:hypothetical protein MOX02_50680 [Methylobacterium oxalidis]GLS64618.1 hypothetical protein GCM10007888_29990 [Methylobacterium oxalidis]
MLGIPAASRSLLDDPVPDLDRVGLGRVHIGEIDALMISGDIVTIVQHVEEDQGMKFSPAEEFCRRQRMGLRGVLAPACDFFDCADPAQSNAPADCHAGRTENSVNGCELLDARGGNIRNRNRNCRRLRNGRRYPRQSTGWTLEVR